MKNELIIEKLTSLGCEEIDILKDGVYFICDGHTYVAQPADIEHNNTIAEMMASADLHCSYCGELSDKDKNFCTNCKEHF